MTGGRERVRELARHITPTRAFVAVLALSTVVFWYVGRHQWFIRDDWAFVLTRRQIRADQGIVAWLCTPQDGHWMAPPLAIYWLVEQLAGIDSYWPFLFVNLALHVTAVVLVRQICLRWGVSGWTTCAVCALLLVFGNGWENIVFAVQITYNLSLVAFLAQVLLSDHDGPIDRRDVLGAAAGVVGVMSSAFGPFYAAAVFVLLVARGRWRAALVAVVPQAVIYSWWLVTWASDPKGNSGDPSVFGASRFVREGVFATLRGMTGQPLFAGTVFFGLAVVLLATRLDRDTRIRLAVFGLLPLPVMFVIGWQRAAEGIATAGASRYQYMSAMVLAAPVGMAIDQLRRLHPRAIHLAWAFMALAVVSNTRLLIAAADGWAANSSASRRVFELVAGAPESATAPPFTTLVATDPDVKLSWLPFLVEEGTIVPRPPATPEEIELVQRVLAGTPQP